MRTIAEKAVLIIFLLCCTIINVSAHPHVFIDYSVVLIFENNALKGIRHVWLFDEMFSSAMAQDYDTDQNGIISPDEKRRIESEAFNNLNNYGYFSDLRIDGRSVPVKEALYFSAAYNQQKRLVYSFFTPVPYPAGSFNELRLSIYDKTYYCSTELSSHGGFAVRGLSQDRYTIHAANRTMDTEFYGVVNLKEIVFKKR